MAIPTPPARFGRPLTPVAVRVVPYDGRTLSAFLKAHGCRWDSAGVWAFLRLNRIGDPFTQLTQGLQVQLPNPEVVPRPFPGGDL